MPPPFNAESPAMVEPRQSVCHRCRCRRRCRSQFSMVLPVTVSMPSLVDSVAAGSQALRDGEARERRRHTAIDLKHIHGVAAADDDPELGPSMTTGPVCFAQHERAGEGDRLLRGEDRRVKLDDAAGGLVLALAWVMAQSRSPESVPPWGRRCPSWPRCRP